MSETNSTNDVLDFTQDNSKLPTGLNVLTILTIIGSILAIVSSFWSFFTAKSSYEKTDFLAALSTDMCNLSFTNLQKCKMLKSL